MGKKNHKPQPPVRPAAQPVTLPFAKIQATVQQTATVVEKPPPDWNVDAVKSLLNSLPTEQKIPLAAFMEQFAEWGSFLQAKAKAFSELEQQLNERQKTVNEELNKARDQLNQDRELHNQTVEADQSEIARRKSEADEYILDAQSERASAEAELQKMMQQRDSLIQREKEVLLREAEFRNGLMDEREASLKTLREQLADLESRRNSVTRDIETKRQQLLAEAVRDADEIRSGAQKWADDLRKTQVDLETLRTDLTKREEKLRLTEELLSANRKSFNEHIQAASKDQIDQLKKECAKLKQKLNTKCEEVDRLQQELDELEDLRQEAGANPGQLMEELDSLRRDNRAKDRELADLRSRAELDDPTELRQQRDHLQQQLDAKEAELAVLRAQESAWNRSVTAQQDWEKTKLVMEKGRTLLHSEAERLRTLVDDLMSRQQAAAVFPALKAMDDNPKLQIAIHTDDVPELPALVKDLQARLYYADQDKPLFFKEDTLQLFIGGLAMSQLHVFQGISGTGKTSLATAFAKAVGGEVTTVAVQAGWRDRADLLGYYNAFEKRFYERNTLQALYRAQTEADKDRLHIVLLDEMNLSRPEQYFADFLSALEMSGNHRSIDLMDSATGSDWPKLLCSGKSVRLPDNVWFIGTANQDETTHTFADKTHDRAFVLDLPRWDAGQRQIPRPKRTARWSFESLREKFNSTCTKFKLEIDTLIESINGSQLTKILADDFQLGWGNRLERQLKRFVPVVIEAGGSKALAVDHLLQSRMFRDGKVVGRHDIKVDDLKRVETQLYEMWNECKLEVEPTRCLAAIARDIKRLERGG
ncbi:MAG: hypothetical protein RLZZ352_3 [Pseudomonadota bacterium]|jgi:hypothetical protein